MSIERWQEAGDWADRLLEIDIERRCIVCGGSPYATIAIAGDLFEPYAVCFEHRHHERRTPAFEFPPVGEGA